MFMSLHLCLLFLTFFTGTDIYRIYLPLPYIMLKRIYRITIKLPYFLGLMKDPELGYGHLLKVKLNSGKISN